MKKTSKTKRATSAERIALLAESGQDVSSYFTNKGKMMPPLESDSTDITSQNFTPLKVVVRNLKIYRKCTRELMGRVHRRDLVYEFFFVFSRFEHALSVTNYLREGNGGVSADWDKFAREINHIFFATLSPEVKKAVIYYEEEPPKKQIVDFDSLVWKDVVPQTDYQLEKLLVLIRRVRNNLFHGEKFAVLLEGDSDRDTQLISDGLTILYACLESSLDIRKKFFSEVEWETEEEEDQLEEPVVTF